MLLRLLTSLPFCLLLTLSCAKAQNMEAMMKWASADAIKYHVVGVYKAKTQISNGGYVFADVTDGVTIDLVWKLSEAKLVGTPKFQNSKSALTNLRDSEPKCVPPVPKGDYEHYEVVSIKDGLAGMLEVQVKRTFPPMEVAQVCTSRRSLPGKVQVQPEELFVPTPMLMGMPPANGVSTSKDGKSIITEKDGWTWTFTPST